MGIDDNLIKTIVSRVLGSSKPQTIILFGSAATGNMHADSDIDLLVIEPHNSDCRKERRKIRESLLGLEYPFDIVVMEKTRFEEYKDVIGNIAYPANHYGKVIYAFH